MALHGSNKYVEERMLQPLGAEVYCQNVLDSCRVRNVPVLQEKIMVC